MGELNRLINYQVGITSLMHILLNTKRKLLCQGRFGEKDNNLRIFFSYY